MREIILFQSGIYSNYSDLDDYQKQNDIDFEATESKANREDYLLNRYYEDEADNLHCLLTDISNMLQPCFLVGTVGRWNGTFDGYKYISDINDLKNALNDYELKISQVGTRLFFTLYHHDGSNYMELRKLTDYGLNNLNICSLNHYTTHTLQFIKRYTRNFGKLFEA